MDWIKQNTKLFSGIVVALLIVGGGGYWVYSQYQRSESASEQLAELRSRWDAFERQSPHPGTMRVDNIASAEADLGLVTDVLESAKKRFAVIDYPAVANSFQFKTMLERGISEMRKGAERSGVRLPQQYAFTFRDQLDKVQFPQESLQLWANQLEEIQLLCGLLFSKRVHSIERVRRVAVDQTIDVSSGEFIDASIQTNEVAVLTPYEVVFKGYSGELASVLEGIANAPQGFRIRAIKVEQTTIANAGGPAPGSTSIDEWNRLRAANAARSQQQQPGNETGASSEQRQMEEMRRRAAEQDLARSGMGVNEGVNPLVRQQLNVVSANRSQGPKISEVVKEKPLEVTLLIDLIKPLPSDSNTQ